MSMPRTPVVAGNWKMFKSPAEARSFFEAFSRLHPPRTDRSVVFFPPALAVAAAAQALESRADIGLGVQNIHWEQEGAFTGEISARMAAAAGVRFVLCGHSERRHVFGETDEQTGLKAAAAVAAGLVPVICVGEKLEERTAGELERVLARQLDAALDRIPAAPGFALAYEPVWAIGTGVNATPGDAADAHGYLRRRMRVRLGDVADQVPILYGGSVKPDNASSLLAAADVDGLLVGGASLDPEGFARIAAA
ncbi:MAG TPA: triose-phosphate isomerase [Longimicrobiales bacterium]|nr:triose-phosphate isomerase [Longimicrobiales bacterium]